MQTVRHSCWRSKMFHKMKMQIPSDQRFMSKQVSGLKRQLLLSKAMQLFWREGYDVTSLDAVCKTLNMPTANFQLAFGSKEQLYREAVRLYLQGAENWPQRILNSGVDTRMAFARFFEAAAILLTAPETSAEDMHAFEVYRAQDMNRILNSASSEFRENAELAILVRLQRGQDEGDLSPLANVRAIAAFVSALLRGMTGQANDGADLRRLLQISRVGMLAFASSCTNLAPSE